MTAPNVFADGDDNNIEPGIGDTPDSAPNNNYKFDQNLKMYCY
jgi:hypothetical protein